MDILEPLEPDCLNESPKSNMPEEEVDVVELEYLEGSLDVAMDDGDQTEVVDGQGVSKDANGAQEPLTYTMDEVMDMEFENPDATTRFYEAYSRAKGFSMRHGRKLRNKSGEVVRYTFLCNREGFRQKKWLEMPDRKREHRAVTRCGCGAEMRIKPKGNTGRWYVSRFVAEHNHDLVPARFVDQLPANRKISEVDMAY